MDEKVAAELCGVLDELLLFAAEAYRKARALEAMAAKGNFTPEAFRQAEGGTDAVARLAALDESAVKLRQALHLPPRGRLTLPEKPDPPELSFLHDED